MIELVGSSGMLSLEVSYGRIGARDLKALIEKTKMLCGRLLGIGSFQVSDGAFPRNMTDQARSRLSRKKQDGINCFTDRPAKGRRQTGRRQRTVQRRSGTSLGKRNARAVAPSNTFYPSYTTLRSDCGRPASQACKTAYTGWNGRTDIVGPEGKPLILRGKRHNKVSRNGGRISQNFEMHWPTFVSRTICDYWSLSETCSMPTRETS